VVLVDGAAVAYLERGGRSLVTFPAAADHPGWVDALVRLVKDGRYRSLEIGRVDGAPVCEHQLADRLREAGFVDSYRGLVYRDRR
jgi:ATP-dependent Lhr-like helicase